MARPIDELWVRLKKLALKDIDAIFGATYKVWVVNSKSATGLYLWDNWKTLYPTIDAVLKLADSPAYIRTFQTFEGESKWLGFGRMSWNEENNKLWTSKYRTTKFKNRNLLFRGTEIWTPDWNHCYKAGETPEIFINVYHNLDSESIKEGVLVAVSKRTYMKNEGLLNSSIDAIQRIVPDSTISRLDRNWTPGGGFVNRIEDMNPQELQSIVLKETGLDR